MLWICGTWAPRFRSAARTCPSLARALMRRTRSNIRGFGIPAWACTAALMPANAVAAERNGTLLQRSELSSGAAQIHRRRAAWDEHWARGGLLTLWMLLQTENGLQLQLQGTGLGFGEAPLMSYGNRLAERSCNGTVRSAVAAERCCSGCHLAPVETAWGLAGDSPRTPQGPRRAVAANGPACLPMRSACFRNAVASIQAMLEVIIAPLRGLSWGQACP